jgi:hypothetical protein
MINKKQKPTPVKVNWYIKQPSNWGLRTGMIKPNLFFYAIDFDSKVKLADFWT